jgi:hypothetical protein
MGWGGIANGALLEKAELEFDVFLTGDLNLRFSARPGRVQNRGRRPPRREHTTSVNTAANAQTVGIASRA